ncbi:MAG: DUF72 domain-containing protein [Desulforhopalus sp.]
MARHKTQIRIGTSGYQYDHWKEIFYPENLAKSDWLEHYCEHFNTVEINNTFYNLPKPETFSKWREKVPENFCFALKFSRYGTHRKKLKDPQKFLPNFIEGASMLHEKLGPILVQLPPKWNANPERLDEFLEKVPGKLRFALEFRDTSWLIDPVFKVLEKYGAALCIHDLIDNHPDLTTSEWVYYRFHGKDYGGDYSYQKLRAVAEKLAAHSAAGRDVYAYFNNDLEGHAIHNARDLLKFVEDRI